MSYQDRSQGTARPYGAAIPGFVVSHHESDTSTEDAPQSAALPHPTDPAFYSSAELPRRFCGSSPVRPRRGVAKTRPVALRRLQRHVSPIKLDIGDDAYAGVPCWSGPDHWLLSNDIGFQLYYDSHIRPTLGKRDTISRESYLKVCAARAVEEFTNPATGRGCRPSVKTLAERCGVSEKVVQRANVVLRRIGAGTEVFRGRQRTKVERLISWRLGDRGRGWTSEYALHPPVHPRILAIAATPHPVGTIFTLNRRPKSSSLAATDYVGSQKRRAARDPSKTRGVQSVRRRPEPTPKATLLAARWLRDPRTPAWAHRHTAKGWARVLEGPAQHDWSARDLNQLLTDHVGLGGWIAHSPRKPIALVLGILKRHDSLETRPAAHDEERDAAELAEARARVARQLNERREYARQREAARLAGGRDRTDWRRYAVLGAETQSTHDPS